MGLELKIVKFTQDFERKNIDIYLIGRLVPQTKIDGWHDKMKLTKNLEDCNLRIYQGADQTGDLAERLSGEVKFEILEDLYVKNEQLIHDKDTRISFLENEIAKLKLKEIRFKEISTEVKINYSDINKISYSNRISTNFTTMDTLPVINIVWNENVPVEKQKENMIRLEEWLKFRLNLDTLQIMNNP